MIPVLSIYMHINNSGATHCVVVHRLNCAQQSVGLFSQLTNRQLFQQASQTNIL